MINAAHENSSGNVAQALETVLEILQGSELYSPYLGCPQVKQDQMTFELVEGLMVSYELIINTMSDRSV